MSDLDIRKDPLPSIEGGVLAGSGQWDHQHAPTFLGPAAFWMPARLVELAWLGHIPFAFWLTAVLRPRVLVELGTHGGASYCAFCQAISIASLGTAAYAVDTWEGDEHSGFYGEEVYRDLVEYNQSQYQTFSRLLRCRFDDALAYFGDHEIDLLHIDGLHTYDAVKHDFETWLPKLTKDGVILLHDTNVRERDFGVWQFWAELATHYPSFTFHHHHGLGVVCVGDKTPAGLEPLIAAGQDPAKAAAWRASFARLGRGVQAQWEAAHYAADAARSATRVADMSEELSKLQADLEQLSTAAATSALERDEHAARHSQALRDLEALQATHAAGQHDLEALQATHAAGQRDLEALQAKHAASRREVSDLARSTTDALNLNAQLETERKALSTNNATLQQELDRHKQACDHLVRELGKHRRRRQIYKSSTIRWATRPIRALLGFAKKPFKRRKNSRGESLQNKDKPSGCGDQPIERRSDIAALDGRRKPSYYGKERRNLLRARQSSVHDFALSPDQTIVRNSQLLDSEWYLSSYIDVTAFDGGAIRHYFEYGAAEGRDPNPLFSTSWYINAYPDVAESGLNPLLHYVTIGSKAGYKPSKEFDPEWYCAKYPDVVAAGFEPFSHYLRHGRSEGRRQNARDKAKEITDAQITILKSPAPAEELALFVTHAPAGRIKPHVPIYLDALRLAGLSTIVIVATDHVDAAETENLLENVDGLLMRENAGYDFAAWAHATLHVDLSSTRLLCLANDSLIGPFSAAALQRIMVRARESDAQLICLTDNYEIKYHFQSYFLIVKDEGIHALKQFLEEVQSLETKQDVIFSYELHLLESFTARGLTGETLFPKQGAVNRTIHDWRGLIQEGFPFVKATVLRSGTADGWQAVLAANGYDPLIAEETIAVIGRSEVFSAREAVGASSAGPLATPAALTDALQSAARNYKFAAARMTELERDIAKVRRRPWKNLRNRLKFDLYTFASRLSPPLSPSIAARYQLRARKRDPNRSLSLPRISDHLEAIATSGSDYEACTATNVSDYEYGGGREYDPTKPSILIVSHDASRSGAPILAQNLVRCLSGRYNVTTICLRPGELLKDFLAYSVRTYHVPLFASGAGVYQTLVVAVCGREKYAFAVVNSAASHAILEPLRRTGVPTVTLVHEFSTYMAKGCAFSDVMRWSDETVFSTELTLHSALETNVLDITPRVHLIPQGKCIVPTNQLSSAVRDDEQKRVRDVLRPADDTLRRFVVLGVGTVEFRKGVDLFLDTASRVLQASDTSCVMFVWFGAGYDPERDLAYSCYLRDQIDRSGLSDRVRILAATTEIEAVYGMSDTLLLSSRLDPLPNVAIEALCAGVPVVCFERASGISEMLSMAGLAEACVARYLDTRDLAEKVLRLACSPEYHADIAARTRAFAATRFDIDLYSLEIEKLGINARLRMDNNEKDVADIMGAGSFRADFFDVSGDSSEVTSQLVRDYMERLNWIAGARKPEPGFNPHVYAERSEFGYDGQSDAYADFLRRGRPNGPWTLPLIEGGPTGAAQIVDCILTCALHIHAYYLEQLRGIVDSLLVNRARPDLFVSVAQPSAIKEAQDLLSDYDGRLIALEVVPNCGRDIGPLLTHFGARLQKEYDVVGHVHLKKSPHVHNPALVMSWNGFLFENMLGGPRGGAMIDRILNRFLEDESIGMVYPDDPHLCGWTQNLAIGQALAQRMGHNNLPWAINFPVGTMFWARSAVLRSFIGLALDWSDYPKEPLAIDGTMLHALERLFGVVPLLEGWRCAVTNVHGITR